MKKAVLIIHGFAGNLSDHEYLEHYLKEKGGYDTYTFLLAGHEKKIVRNVTREDWIKSAESELNKIIERGYKDIYVIGHSMGGLIAGHLVGKYPQIKKVVLSAPAYKGLVFTEKGISIFGSLRLGLRLMVDKDKTNSGVARRIFRVAPKETKELMQMMGEHQDDIFKIHIPTLILHGSKDEIVPVSSSKEVFDKIDSKCKVFVTINDITHPIFRTEKKEIACKIVLKFLKSKKDTIIEEIV